MFALKDNIYKIIFIMSINDTSIPHDMQVIDYIIIWSYMLLIKPLQ
jgi:hypothetical protein